MKANEMMRTVTIEGREYSVDPTNGLACVRVLQDRYAQGDFSWAIPAGYEEYQAVYMGADDVDPHTDRYVVWFGTLAQIVAARDPRCRFVPAEEVAA